MQNYVFLLSIENRNTPSSMKTKKKGGKCMTFLLPDIDSFRN